MFVFLYGTDRLANKYPHLQSDLQAINDSDHNILKEYTSILVKELKVTEKYLSKLININRKNNSKNNKNIVKKKHIVDSNQHHQTNNNKNNNNEDHYSNITTIIDEKTDLLIGLKLLKIPKIGLTAIVSLMKYERDVVSRQVVDSLMSEIQVLPSITANSAFNNQLNEILDYKGEKTSHKTTTNIPVAPHDENDYDKQTDSNGYTPSNKLLLKDKTIVFTGRMTQYTREQASTICLSLGIYICIFAYKL